MRRGGFRAGRFFGVGKRRSRPTYCGLSDGRRTGTSGIGCSFVLGRSAITPNYGFEALGYDRASGLFWTVTENALKTDGRGRGTRCRTWRLPSFARVSGVTGCRVRRMLIRWICPNRRPKENSMLSGVVAIWPQEGGRLWVMEREFNVPKRRLKARTDMKIYEVVPGSGTALPKIPRRNGCPATL